MPAVAAELRPGVHGSHGRGRGRIIYRVCACRLSASQDRDVLDHISRSTAPYDASVYTASRVGGRRAVRAEPSILVT